MRVQRPRLELEPDDADPAWASQVQHASPKHSAIPRARTWQLTENGHATTWVQSRSCFTGAWISAWRCSARCWPSPVPGHRLVDACLRPGVNQSDYYSKKMLRPDADRLAGVCHGYAGRQLAAPLPRPVNQAFPLDTALERRLRRARTGQGWRPGSLARSSSWSRRARGCGTCGRLRTDARTAIPAGGLLLSAPTTLLNGCSQLIRRAVVSRAAWSMSSLGSLVVAGQQAKQGMNHFGRS
jgi:hypothetical protein